MGRFRCNKNGSHELPFCCRLKSLFVHLRLQIILQADGADQAELGFQPVDMVFFRAEDVLEQFTAGIVTDALAVGDGRFQVDMRPLLDLQVALEHFLGVLADQQLAQVLHVR